MPLFLTGRLKKLTGFIFLMWVLSIPSFGQEKSDINQTELSPVALSIYKDKSTPSTLVKKANKGDDVAALMLGYMYRLGHKVKKNPTNAVKWFKKSANKGNAEGQLQMAVMYAAGEGVKQDYDAMRYWLEKSASNGYGLSQFQLGLLYAKGITVDQDMALARMWLGFAAEQPGQVGQMAEQALNNLRKEAIAAGLDFIAMPSWVETAEKYGKALALLQADADKGNAHSQYLLGMVFYWLGEKAKEEQKNIFYKEAAQFFRQAAEQKYLSAQYMLGKLYFDGKGVSSDIDQALSWMEKSAESGDVSAQIALGEWYDSASHRNPALAQLWYERAKAKRNWYATAYFIEEEIIATAPGKRDMPIKQWDARDQYVMALSYEKGLGVPVDLEQAVAWYRLAASQLLPFAQRRLGLALLDGYGVAKNEMEARVWLELAAEQNDAEALAALGDMYAKENGVFADDEKAFSAYQKAANQGVYRAQEGIGIFYHEGKGIKKDQEAALQWLEKAALHSATAMELVLAILQEKASQ